jgi:Family of unknown function (DUF5684)
MLMGILFAGILAQQDQGGGGSAIMSLIYLIIAVIVIASLWKVYTKAGKPGWAAIIPIYNLYVLLQIVGRPWWWLLLMLIPVVNFIIAIIVYIDLAKSFGKGVGFGIGLLFLSFIFLPILGFGDAQYVGPAAAQGSPAMA